MPSRSAATRKRTASTSAKVNSSRSNAAGTRNDPSACPRAVRLPQRWIRRPVRCARLGLVCLTNAPRFVRDAQAGAARLTHADVHALDTPSKREWCRDTDGTDRDDFAGLRDVGFQKVTTDESISDESLQSRCATPAPPSRNRRDSPDAWRTKPRAT